MAAAGVRQPFLKGEVMNQTSFGKDNKGVEYTLYSFTNKNNMTMVLSDLGATLVKLLVPAKDGSVKDVVLGY